MRRKKIKFSPKLQSSSLNDIKRFVPKDALNTPVISNYNTLPTSYQKGGKTDPKARKTSEYMDDLSRMDQDSIINSRFPGDTDVAIRRLEEMYPHLLPKNKNYSKEQSQAAMQASRLYLSAPMTDQRRIEREENTVAAKPLTTFELMERDNVGYFKQPTKMDETGLSPVQPAPSRGQFYYRDGGEVESYQNGGLPKYQNGGEENLFTAESTQGVKPVVPWNALGTGSMNDHDSGESVKESYRDYLYSQKHHERLMRAGRTAAEAALVSAYRLEGVEGSDVKRTTNPSGFFPWLGTGFTGERREGQGSAYHPAEGAIYMDPAQIKGGLNTTYNDVLAHEYSHAADRFLGAGLNDYERNELSSRLIQENIDNDHDRDPDENKADLDAARFFLTTVGVDPGTQDISSYHMNLLESSDNFTIKRAFNNYGRKNLQWLLNNIADSKEQKKELEQTPQSLQQLPQARNGGLPKYQNAGVPTAADSTNAYLAAKKQFEKLNWNYKTDPNYDDYVLAAERFPEQTMVPPNPGYVTKNKDGSYSILNRGVNFPDMDGHDQHTKSLYNMPFKIDSMSGADIQSRAPIQPDLVPHSGEGEALGIYYPAVKDRYLLQPKLERQETLYERIIPSSMNSIGTPKNKENDNLVERPIIPIQRPNNSVERLVKPSSTSVQKPRNSVERLSRESLNNPERGQGRIIVDEKGNRFTEAEWDAHLSKKGAFKEAEKKAIPQKRNGGLHRYQNGGAVVTDYDKNWDYKKEDGVVYTKRKDAEKWMSPKVGSAAELAIQKNVFGSPSELEEAVQMPIPESPIPESPNLNVTPPQAIGDTIQSVAPLPMDMAPTAPTERMLPEMSMPDISMPDIDMPDLSLSEKLLQAQGMLGSLWEGAKDMGGDIMDDVASAGSTVSSFLQDRVEDINEEVTDAIKFKKEAEETVAAKSQQISNYLSDIFTPDSEEAEPISPEQAPAKKSRTEAFAEMLRGSVPDMPELSGSPVDALMNPIGLTVGLPVAGAMGLYDKLKGIEVPDLPDVTLPKMQMPDVSIPDLPDMPDLPDVSIPDLEVPKVSLPDMPDISMPDMPDVGAFTGYAKEVISDAVESGQSSLSDLKNFFKGELIDYAEDFKETGENIKEGINSAIDAAKDLPDLLSSIADVEEEVKKERGDSGAPGPPPEVEPDLVLSPEDANPKETFEEMLIRGANSLQSGHILDSSKGVMYRIENGKITKKMETIVGKNTALHKGAVAQLSYATKLKKHWYNGDGSLRKFETPEGLKTGPEIKREGLWEKYGGGATAAGIYEFTHQPIKGYEKYPGYNSYLKALPGTPTNFVATNYRGEDGKLNALGSYMGYHQFPNKLKEIRAAALERLDISNELSAGCIQNSECDNKDMGILLQSNPSMADSLIILNADMGPLSAAAIDDLAKRFDSAESEKEKSGVLQKLLALSTPD